MTDIKENSSWQGESMERMLSSILEIYREIEELQDKINDIYKKAKIKMNGEYEDEDDKEFDKDYFKCIESYVRN